MNLEIRPATDGDCMNLAAFMREDDESECVRSGFRDGLHALRWSLGVSDYAYVAEIDGEPVAMYGLRFTDVIGQRGLPWVLTGRGIEKHRKTFLRVSRWVVQEMARR